MLAQIKSLPEGEMKTALLDTYIKTVQLKRVQGSSTRNHLYF
jgi:hypothetical protein